jgi:iron complex transport system ATP-binding protein
MSDRVAATASEDGPLPRSAAAKLQARGLAAGYPAAKELVLRALDLEIKEGEVVALAGPNGSGKSTLLRVLGRVLRPRGGAVLLDGRELAEWSTRDVARRLALLPQGPTLSNDMTALELVWLGRSPHQGLLGLPNREDRDAVDVAIRETGISPLTDRAMSSLSGGERQRVWLAMALAQEPRVLLLDEPTTFLDLNHQLEVLDLVHYLNREHGLTVVMVLHDLNQAVRYAGRVVVLREGKIYGDGPPAEVVTPRTLREVFGVEAKIMPALDGAGMVVVPLSRVGAPAGA